MPLFSSKFTPKKTTPRKASISSVTRDLDPEKSAEILGLEVGPISLCLGGDQDVSFVKGEWVPQTGPVSGAHKENIKLKQYIQQLEDENNLLKLKCEILLDMLTETTAEAHLQDKEINQLRNNVETLTTSHVGLQR